MLIRTPALLASALVAAHAVVDLLGNSTFFWDKLIINCVPFLRVVAINRWDMCVVRLKTNNNMMD